MFFYKFDQIELRYEAEAKACLSGPFSFIKLSPRAKVDVFLKKKLIKSSPDMKLRPKPVYQVLSHLSNLVLELRLMFFFKKKILVKSSPDMKLRSKPVYQVISHLSNLVLELRLMFFFKFS